MQNGKDSSVARRVQKLVGVPARRERSRFRFPIPHDATHEQVRVVESRAIRVRERIAEFTALVNRSGSFRSHVTWNSAREGELFEQFLQALFGLRNVRIDFAIGAFKVGVGYQPGAAMSGPGNVNDIEIELFDQAVQVNVDEVQPRSSSPMAEKPRLDVFQ